MHYETMALLMLGDTSVREPLGPLHGLDRTETFGSIPHKNRASPGSSFARLASPKQTCLVKQRQTCGGTLQASKRDILLQFCVK